jgi:hypothetical protein
MLVGLVLGTAIWWIPGWRTTGHVPYVVDDAWIHLTIVENLRDHATFGVVPGVYESASSAPLWNLLLTPLSFLPVPLDWWPLLVDLAAAAWILWRISGLGAARWLAGSVVGTVALVVLPVAMGLPQIAATGMEHMLQAAIAVELLRAVSRRVDRARLDGGTTATTTLVACGFFGTLLRFETAFLVAASCLVLLAWGPGDTLPTRVRRVVALALAPLAAVGLFAAVNLSFGQSLLPNSVLAKSSASPLGLTTFLDNIQTDPWLPLLAILTATLAARGRLEGFAGEAAAGFAAVGATVAHLLLADVGNFDRYQEWLVVILFWSSLANAAPVPVATPPRDQAVATAGRSPAVRGISVGSIVLAIALLAVPKVELLRLSLVASEDIHLLQEQTARFLDEYHDTDAVGLHDLGWVAWLHDGPIVDLEGLATHEVMLGIRAGTYDRALVAGLFDDAGVSVVAGYDGAFDAVLPDGWEPAATWCIRSPRVVLSHECFTFYGRTEAERDVLREQLAEFDSELPDGVTLRTR